MANLKELIVNGVSHFIGKVFINDSHITTINGVEVTENPKFTDTVTTATTSGNGNAVTAISASNGSLTVTKGTTFLTSHQDISGKADKSATVSNVAYDPTNKKITKTINGTTSDVVAFGSAAFVNSTSFPNVSTYSLPQGKGVQIKYTNHEPVLVSVQRNNGSARLILIGGGYGYGGWVRNDFTELVSCSSSIFQWCIPESDSISTTVEVFNVTGGGTATVIVWSNTKVTFTQIDALTSTAQNRKLLHSKNYTDYTVTQDGNGASGTWNISINGNVTGNVTGDVTGRTSSMLIQNIASNANLNTITTDGWYMASTDTIASSLSNCPSTKSFLMEVYHINSATGSNEVIYQKISTSENIHYERVKSGGAWSEWKSSCHIDLNGVVYI